MSSRRFAVIGVEGLIGAGKTSLSRELAAALGALLLLEPDEKGGSNPYLADYYGDPKRWSLVLQVHQLQARFRMHQRAQWHVKDHGGHAVLDRTYFGDTCFARLQLKLGLMSEREFQTYESIYDAMTASVQLPSVVVRVLATPEVCAARIQKRMETETGRKCESSVDLSYLRGLEQEIDYMVGALRQQGVTIFDMPWDADRDSPEVRFVSIAALAARIDGIAVLDNIMTAHKRIV